MSPTPTDPSLKAASRIAAHGEHSAIANIIEVLVREYCKRAIAIPAAEPTQNHSGEHS